MSPIIITQTKTNTTDRLVVIRRQTVTVENVFSQEEVSETAGAGQWRKRTRKEEK